MDMLKDTVIIDASDYEGLIRANAKFEILKNLLVNSVELNYSGEYIRVDDEAVFRAINAVDKYALPERERELREAWEKKHKEEEANE
jgi:hypothetical protein